MGVKDYDLNPDNNTQINGINIAEGCPPSGINNAVRQLMADVKADSDAQNEALKNFSETPASAEKLGPVKVGDGLTMGEDGTLSAVLATADVAGRVKASETALAGAVPLGGADGTLGEDWLKKAMDAANAAQSAADDAKDAAVAAQTYRKISERSSAGNWTITGCTIGKPLKIYFTFTPQQASDGEWDEVRITTKSGADMSYTASDYSFALGLGQNSNWASTNIFEVIPKSTTVVLSVTYYTSGKLLAYN